jgi:hypothetical protein
VAGESQSYVVSFVTSHIFIRRPKRQQVGVEGDVVNANKYVFERQETKCQSFARDATQQNQLGFADAQDRRRKVGPRLFLFYLSLDI